MSAAHNKETDWNYRTIDKRHVIVKAKNGQVRKASVIDVLTGFPFPIEAATDFQLESLEVEKEYYVTLKVYTLKNVKEAKHDFVEFFEALDVDQAIEDFIKAYWLYPNYIRFELVEAEQP